jgi:proteic killer suppression protein
MAFPNLHLLLRRTTRYYDRMVKSFRHKGLKRFFESGSLAGIQPQHGKRLRMQLTAIDTAISIEDIDIPGFRLHRLKGPERGRWSIWVNGN